MKRIPASTLASFISLALVIQPVAAQVVPVPLHIGVAPAGGAMGAAASTLGAAPSLSPILPTTPSQAALPAPSVLSVASVQAAAAQAAAPAAAATPTAAAAPTPATAPRAAAASVASPVAAQPAAQSALHAVTAVSSKDQDARSDAKETRSPLALLRRLATKGAGLAEAVPAFAMGVMRPHSPSAPVLPRGVTLDRAPQSPTAAGAITPVSRFHLAPNQVLADGSAPVTLNADPSDPASVERALRALVDSDPGRFGASSTFGAPSADMAKVHVELLKGMGEQADSYVAVFRQWKKGTDRDGSPYYLLVDGANLRFHVKVLGGKPVLMAVEGGFAADVDPALMTPGFDDGELARKAAERVSSPDQGAAPESAGPQAVADEEAPQPSAPKLLTRLLTTIEGGWHAVNIYQASDLQGQAVIVAVDVHSGQAWAFNAQEFRSRGFMPERAAPAKAASVAVPAAGAGTQGRAAAELEGSPDVEGSASARGTTLTPEGGDHGPTGAMPLAHAKVYDDAGRVVAVTEADGSFTVPAEGSGPRALTIRLDGVYSGVTDGDAQNAPLAARLTVLPGQSVKAVLNPTGDSEESDADVNAYVYSYKLFDWFKSFLGLEDARLYTPLAGGIHANDTTMAGNAFYSPETDGFYLMRRATVRMPVKGKDGRRRMVAVTFENTAQPSIILHELGHRFIQMASRILLGADQMGDPAYRFVSHPMDPVITGDANEAFADLVSMFIRENPVLGQGFIVDGPAGLPQIIRTGENTTRYDPEDPNQSRDPHARGEILMGAGWKGRAALIESMGPVQGALYAALLFVRTTLYVQPEGVVNALAHALLADMTRDGRLPHEAAIRAAAQAHGVDLPAPPQPPAS